MNKVFLLGRLGKDPILKYTASGVAVGNFSLATSKKYNDEEKTEWHNISVFKKVAENCNKFLKKGSQVLVEGEVQYKSYEKDGEQKYFTQINAYNVQFLDSKKEQGQVENYEMPTSNNAPEPGFASDDIPF